MSVARRLLRGMAVKQQQSLRSQSVYLQFTLFVRYSSTQPLTVFSQPTDTTLSKPYIYPVTIKSDTNLCPISQLSQILHKF